MALCSNQMSWVFEAAYYSLVLSYWVHTKRWNWRVKSFKNWNFFRISCIASHTDSDSHCRYCIENIVCISKGIKSLPFKTKAKLFWLNWTNSLKSFEIDLVLVFISFCSNQLSLIFCSTILYTVELNPKPNLTVQLFFWSSHHHHS